MLKSLSGVAAEAFPNGLACASDHQTLGVHSGTHIDDPWHHHLSSEGKRFKTPDEFPLAWAYSDGVVLNMTHKRPGGVISLADIHEALKKINYHLKPLDIVLTRTDTISFGTQRSIGPITPGWDGRQQYG